MIDLILRRNKINLKTKSAKIPKTLNEAAERCAGWENIPKNQNKASGVEWSLTKMNPTVPVADMSPVATRAPEAG